ncbi:MAG TPA: AAA family ATPase [Bacteroidales bacterium]|nr:AAA family ATPase [Bacteroidales bacterium]
MSKLATNTAATRPMFINMPVIRTAKQRLEAARNLPPIKKLFGEIWQNGELHLLFADTGAGKSIMAVQIADAISKGLKALPLLENENEPSIVLYHDYELSDRQFFQRYSDEAGNTFDFSENLRIDNVDFALMMSENPEIQFVELLQEKIKSDVEGSKLAYPGKDIVLIVDNISYLHTQSTIDQQIALSIMRFLDGLKREFGISILVVAHTPKIDLNTPLHLNHLAGSKALSNFADGVSAIGKSNAGINFRYLKQVKPSRNGQMVYDRDNVIALELVKQDCSLHFIFSGVGPETDHLSLPESTTKDDRKMQALEMHGLGKSLQEISESLNVGKTTVHRWIKNAKG